MSQDLVKSLSGMAEYSFRLVENFIDACSDDLWAEKKGGWPIWQQVAHAITSVDFFIEVPGEVIPPPLASAEALSLKSVSTETVSKSDMKASLKSARSRVNKFVAALNDEDLPKRNESLFAKSQMDLTLAYTISLIGAHALYHLGSCDAALRDRGLAGVF